MKKVPELFGSMVFNEAVMKERLPKDVYKSLKQTVRQGTALDPQVAGVVANAMKDWAIEKGATHFTHWFQPMTGITAEKHDSFISPCADGTVIMEFSGKELMRAGCVVLPLRRPARDVRGARLYRVGPDELCVHQG